MRLKEKEIVITHYEEDYHEQGEIGLFKKDVDEAVIDLRLQMCNCKEEGIVCDNCKIIDEVFE